MKQIHTGASGRLLNMVSFKEVIVGDISTIAEHQRPVFNGISTWTPDAKDIVRNQPMWSRVNLLDDPDATFEKFLCLLWKVIQNIM